MAIFRINKNKNFTSMSNYHLQDKNLSLKAKGLLSVMLSLPEKWNYSIEGLASINKESSKQIKLILDELKKCQYLYINKLMPNETKSGRIEYIYDIYEKPKTRVPKQEGCIQEVENKRVVLGDNKILKENTNIENTNNKKEIYKESFGTYKRVKLTNEEYLRLVNEFGEDFIKQQIEYLDEYVESNNNKNKYTNFNLVLRKAIRENWFSKQKGEDDFLLTMKKEREKYGR